MELTTFFEEHPKVALGFSGGVDSAYLLYAGIGSGAAVQPYYVRTAFQPAFELEDAKRLCQDAGVELKIVDVDILSAPCVAENGEKRCYHCKKALFGALKQAAEQDGFTVLIDGTNASDDADDRPGMQALGELEVLSPLRLCGLTKGMIRGNSLKFGLFTWNKPAYACLATRIPTGTPIEKESLEKVEKAENALMDMNFSDLRVRMDGKQARIEIPAIEMGRVIEQREAILEAMGGDFSRVVLDLEGR